MGTWLEDFYTVNNTANGDLYVASFYWTVQTITTVGYGGNSGDHTGERIYCVFIMFIGVISFTFANGSLASILSSYDEQNVDLNQKLEVLNKIRNEYLIPRELYIECRKHLEENNRQEDEEI
jgi:hypothetical protein